MSEETTSYSTIQFPALRSLSLVTWGGAGLVIAAGSWVTHLPAPIELLGWAGLTGAGLWFTRRLWRPLASASPQYESSVTLDQVRQALSKAAAQFRQLEAESPEGSEISLNYTAQLAQIEHSLSRQTLKLQIVGTRAVGKTALHQLLASQTSEGFEQHWFCLDDELAAESLQVSPVPEGLHLADVVLFVVQGDLTQGEWVALQQLQTQRKRVLVLLNKQDQYLPAQAHLVVEQVRQRVFGVVAADDVVAISTCPQPIRVRHHQKDDSYEDTWETPPPQIQPLLARMEAIAGQEVKQLVLQRAYQHTLIVQTAIQTKLNQIRRNRALPLIERYQWIAAGAAFATPLPSLDMVATAAITGKMIRDLAQVYQIQLSLERATEIAKILGKTLIQMGLVEASSQLLSTVLKGNAVTFVAGGTLQGVGAAYFTRMAGLSLAELFEAHCGAEGWRLDSTVLSQIVQRVFRQHQRLDVFKNLVQQTLRRLRPEDAATVVSL